MIKKYVIVDIDGTVADASHRIHHAKNGDWDEFFDKVDLDTPIEPIIRLLSDHVRVGATIIFCTGRKESCRYKTKDWIDKHIGPANFQILMRSEGDRRPDYIVKPELLSKIMMTPERVLCIYEDNSSEVKEWRRLGYTCLQVADRDF